MSTSLIRNNLGVGNERKVKAITVSDTPYSALTTDDIILVDASGGAVTITLPTAVVGQAGKAYTIKRTDILASSVLVTIGTTSSQTIDGALNQYLWNADEINLVSDNTNWQVINKTPHSEYGIMLKGATADRRYTALSQTVYAAAVQGTTAPLPNTLWAEPFYVTKTTKFDTITFNITTGAGTSQARAGVYLDNGNMYPGKLIYDTGAISTVSSGVKNTTITAGLQVFAAGLYWLAWECDTTGLQVITNGSTTTMQGLLGRLNTFTASVNGYAYSVAHTFGSLPDPYTAGASLLASAPGPTNPVILIGLRPI